jgi:hypothetical protein
MMFGFGPPHSRYDTLVLCRIGTAPVCLPAPGGNLAATHDSIRADFDPTY